MGRRFKIAGWKERGMAYFMEGIYARHALSGFASGYIIYMIFLVMGWI